MERIQAAFVERGVWVRPFGRLVYLMPPYCIDSADLADPDLGAGCGRGRGGEDDEH